MRSSERLAWYRRRLAVMGPREVVWRAGRAAAGAVEAARPPRDPGDAALLGRQGGWGEALAALRDGRGRPRVLRRDRALTLAAAAPDEMDAVVAAADRAAAGRMEYFGYGETDLGPAIDWHRDGPTGARWPDRPSARIDYRHGPADPKWIWELNRLQHLPWLAQAWLVTGDDRYAEAALDQLDGWIEQSPPGRGVAWRGGFEAGIRAISVAIALQGLADSPALTPERFARAARALAEMARRGWSERSRHSSANNHLVGELAGCATVALLLPELAPAAGWERRAVRALAREADRQVLADGAGAEQAFEYQVFTGDLLLVVASLLRLSGRPVPRALGDGLVRGGRYMAGVLGDSDPEPRYGDADDGFALRLGAEGRRHARAHLGAVAALTGDPAARRAGTLDLAARWLTGDEGERRFAATRPGPAPRSFVAPVGGMVTLRAPGRRVMLDAGPLGYLSIAAHGHADALAVTLAQDGRDLVGDPGPASYFAHPDWRRAHRSTAAHATIAVDGRDQSESGGPFLWTRHASCRLLEADPDAGWAVAEHDGYSAPPHPVVHRRHLSAPAGGPVVVVDLLTAEGAHEVSSAWPLHPDLEAEADGLEHRVTRDGAPALLVAHAASAPLDPYAVRGDEATALGWWSERLEERRPAWLVGVRGRVAGDLAIATLLWPHGGSGWPAPGLDCALTREAVTVRWTDGDAETSLVIERRGAGVAGAPRAEGVGAR